MRILQLAKFYPPDPGGIEHVVANLSSGLAARGHQVRVVAGQGLVERPARQKLRPTAAPLPVPIASAVDLERVRTYGILWSQPIAPAYLRAARWTADIVHVHHPHPLADLAVLCGAGKGGAGRPATIITHHSDVRRQRAIAQFYMPLVRSVIRRSRAVIVATQAHLTISSELKGARDKCHVIPYGVDPGLFEAPDAVRIGVEWRERWGGPRRVVLAVGRLVWYKGFDVLLKAAVGLDAHVVIAGHGPERQPLDDLAAELGIRQRVHFTGYVASGALPGLYHAADVAVLPSVDAAEMFGITLLEAMASGKPVVSTRLPTGVQEVNLTGETGLAVEPGNAASLAQALGTLLSDPERARAMGQKGRKRVRECFSVEQMVDRHEGLYAALASRSA